MDSAAVNSVIGFYGGLTGHDVDVSVFVLVVGMIRVLRRDFQVCRAALDLLEWLGGSGGRGGEPGRWMLADNKRPRNGITLVQNKSALKYVVFMMVLSFLSFFLFFFCRIFSTWEREREEGGTSIGGIGLPRQGQHGRTDAYCHWCSNSRGQLLLFETTPHHSHPR